MKSRKRERPADILEERNMIVFAFRYALGRMSAAPSICADWLVKNWKRIPEPTRNIIRRDLEEAFARDDGQRQREREEPAESASIWKPLGHDCDRAQWSRVRALYRTPTCCLCGAELGSSVPQTVHVDGERSCRDCVPWECDRCGKPFAPLENTTVDPVTRRSRHVMKCEG